MTRVGLLGFKACSSPLFYMNFTRLFHWSYWNVQAAAPAPRLSDQPYKSCGCCKLPRTDQNLQICTANEWLQWLLQTITTLQCITLPAGVDCSPPHTTTSVAACIADCVCTTWSKNFTLSRTSKVQNNIPAVKQDKGVMEADAHTVKPCVIDEMVAFLTRSNYSSVISFYPFIQLPWWKPQD